jgi:hypothetical protein
MEFPFAGLHELCGPMLRERQDPREAIADPHARYFGAELSERTLVPGDGADLGETRFEDWLGQQQPTLSVKGA